jgi:hypothetical protein
MNPRLGLILMFEGDIRRATATIRNVTTFTSLAHALKNGDTDVTTLYVGGSPDKLGNMLISARIGSVTTIPSGSYRYFISGTYGGKQRTWYWDVIVLPQDVSLLAGMDIPLDDYDPFVEEVTIYEGDNFAKQIYVPDLQFTAADGKLRLLAQDVTATYCSGTPTPLGSTITTHNIGTSVIPAGDYGYFLTGTYFDNDNKSTWYWKVKVLPKQGVLP